MTTFYLIRHGEPDWALNEKYKLKGHGRDLPHLTQRGIEQAKEAATDSRLKNSEIILSSPYTRALQTAAIISKEIDVDIVVEFDLREWQPDLNFETDNLEDLKRIIQDYEKNNGIYPLGEKRTWETKEMMKNRMDLVLKKYSGYSFVSVVAHEQIIRTHINVEKIPHCSITEFVRD